MPTNIAEPHPNYGPIAGLAVPVPAGGYLPPASMHEHLAARELLGTIEGAGDEGAARSLVQRLEHGLATWTVSPWRLLDAVCAELIRRAPATVPAETPGAEPAAPEPTAQGLAPGPDAA